MNKLKLFSLILYFTVSSAPTEAWEQQTYVFYAELHNICGYPIHVRAWSFSYATPIDIILGPEEKSVVLTFYGLNNNPEDAEDGFHSYGLAISSEVSKNFFDWEKFLVILRKSEKSQRGGVITLALKDKSLCPGN